MTGEQGMGYHEWLLLNEALEVEHPVFVINLANRSGEFQRTVHMPVCRLGDSACPW